MAKQDLFTYENDALLVAALYSLLRWGSVGPIVYHTDVAIGQSS